VKKTPMKKKPNPPPNSLSFSQIVTRAIIAATILLLFSAFAVVITNVYFHPQSDDLLKLPDAPLQKSVGSRNQNRQAKEPGDDVNLTFYERLSRENPSSAESLSSPVSDSQAKLLPAPVQEKKIEGPLLDSNRSARPTEDQIDPVFYSVQVGSFQNLEAAQGVLNKLRREGFSPFITPVHFPEGAIRYRVRIGSALARNDAEKIAQEIRKKGVFQPLVVSVK